jgi:outer membrane receptor protein involved in Fe transport
MSKYMVSWAAMLAVFNLSVAAAAQQATPIPGNGLQPLPLGGPAQIASGTAFNPAISVIIDGKYYNDNRKGGAADILEQAQGFHGGHGADDEHGHGELSRGFNLDETELVFSASVDNYFDARVTLSLRDDSIEVEEAFGRTRSLPAGLQLTFGKFFSGIGYINQQHPHEWAFADQVLPYRLIFGDEGLNEVGLQLTWLPQLPVYTLFGLEALQGKNEGVAATLEGPEGLFGQVDEKAGPRLFTGFFKMAPDLGFKHAAQFGLFGGVSRLHQKLHGAAEVLEGDVWFAGADAVYKYDAGGDYGKGNLVLQGEYIYRVKDLAVAAHADENEIGEEEKFTQDGFYIQGAYGFAPRWTAGLRYEMVGLTNKIRGEEETENLDDSKRYSAALTFNPTEFSRLRMQYTRGDIATDAGPEKFNQVFLQFQLALGVHGAHRF